MHYRFLSIVIIFVMLSISQGNAVLVSDFLRLRDEEYPSSGSVGETLFVKGIARSAVNKDMRVSLSLVFNDTDGKDWRVLDVKPGNIFTIPAQSETPYLFEIQFLQPGRFSIHSEAKILEIVGSPYSGEPPQVFEGEEQIISVQGGSASLDVLLYLVIPAIAIGSLMLIYTSYRQRLRKSAVATQLSRILSFTLD